MQRNSRTAEAIAAFQSGKLDRARALAQAQLDEAEDSAEIHHLLGLIECRDGRIESGVGHLRAALGAAPGNPAFRVMLARALIDSGRPEEALDVAVRPKGLNGAAQALWHARAEAAHAGGNREAATEAWAVLCAAQPNDWRSWLNYGEALAALERWSAAADALFRAWLLNPGHPPIGRNLVTALTKADRAEQTIEELQQTIRWGGEDISGRLALLALLLERTSRIDDLEALLNFTKSYGIDQETLAYPMAMFALRKGDGAEAKRLLEMESCDLDPVRWHTLMSRILDSLGDAKGAFNAAARMKLAVPCRDSWLRRGASYRQRVRDVAETIKAASAEELCQLPPGSRRPPAFLIGFPRSGTTLLDTFLMGHPNVTVVEEFPMLGAAQSIAGDIPLRVSNERLGRARQAYFDELDRHIDGEFSGLVVDKLPLNMIGLPIIQALFPDAPVIFAQRHPCDCVLSAFMQGFALNDAMACFLTIEGSADLYDAAMDTFSASREMLGTTVHTVVYEELIEDPEAALRPVVEFLGLDWHADLLNHQVTAVRRGAISTPSYDQVVRPLTKAPSGRWRRYEEQLAPVLPVLLPWAKRLGYAD